jgi:hypothetical protein
MISNWATYYNAFRLAAVSQSSVVSCPLSVISWLWLFPTYDLPPTNYLYFQQHSRFQHVSALVF